LAGEHEQLNNRSMARLLLLFAPVLVVACGSGRVRDANAPLSPAAQSIEVLTAAKPACKKLGGVHGIGEDLDEKVSDTQATNAAKEEAVKLGGDSIVFVTTTSDAKAGSGGTQIVINKSADVLKCK
jgi:hypothetical protein